MSEVKNISVNKVDELLGKVNLIDIREVFEYEEGSLKTAVNIPMGELLKSPEEYLKDDEEYYILCRSGARSYNTCIKLLEQGYNVINVSGGVIEYIGNNFVKSK